MRDATAEERQSVRDYIKRISEDYISEEGKNHPKLQLTKDCKILVEERNQLQRRIELLERKIKTLEERNKDLSAQNFNLRGFLYTEFGIDVKD